jgi:hypothetical protein
MRSTCLALLALLAASAAPALGQSAAPAPCSSAEHRQFDFWLGEWEVRTPAGQLAGTNRIARVYGGCVLHEQYDTGRGYSGASFNVYDVGLGMWHQTWVDTSGMLLKLDGGFREGRMVMEGETVAANGSRTRHRITWTPNADGSVRQLWESTNPSGEWAVAFDGRYTKTSPAG